MWLHATRTGPSGGMCSNPSKRQLNHSATGGRRDHSAKRYQGSALRKRLLQRRLAHSRAVCMLPAMRVLAVPVKSLERAKNRLSSVLSPGERAALSLVMFEDVLDAGLALVTAEALASALALGGRVGVVAAPAASDGGTNLLLRRPPSIIPARFGSSSFAKHRWAARRVRTGFEEIRRPELAFDLDRPEDLARVLADGVGHRTRAACLEMGMPGRLRVLAINP